MTKFVLKKHNTVGRNGGVACVARNGPIRVLEWRPFACCGIDQSERWTGVPRERLDGHTQN